MPVNAGGAIQTDMLSGIEEESDIYEAFAPHVDYANIPLSTESSPGEFGKKKKTKKKCKFGKAAFERFILAPTLSDEGKM